MPGNVVNTSGLFTVSPSATTSYTLTASNANGCSATTTGTVTVNPLPTPTLSSETICIGQTATLSATGGTSYTLTPGNILNNSGVFTLTPSATTNYTLTASNANGCIATTTGTVTVNPLPTPTLSNAIICAGQTATLNATGGTSYTLTPGNIINASGVFTVSPSATTNYTVIAANGNGCSATATGTVTVNPLPIPILTSETICVGQTATLNATGGTSYTLTPGNIINTSGVFSLTPSATTSYTLTASNGNGCSATATGTVTVNPLPTPTLTSETICTGQTATLTAAGGTSYTLTPGNVVNTSGLFAVSPSATTSYTVIAANANGCSATATGTVTVNPLPTPTLSSATICAGQTATLLASGANTYAFSAPGASGNTLTVQPAITTTYSVTGTDSFGCQGVASASVTVNPQPTVMVLNTSCNGSTTFTVSFTATAGATIAASAGTLSGNQVLNVPSGTSLTITASLGSCSATASVTRDCSSNIAALGDYVFIDSNANGIQDGGDLPLPGVVVTLLSNGSALATTTTNGSGLYSFTGLVPGTPYSVSFTTPAGYSVTTQQVANSTDTNDSDASVATGQTRSVTMAAGETNGNLDAGFVKLLPTYAVAKTVDLKQVEKGQIVTYTLSLTNTSTVSATNLVLTDQLSSMAVTFMGSATASAGTFVPGSNSGTWSISSLAAGQVATLSVHVQLNEEGIIYNTVTAPDGQTATVCTTVPFHVCANVAFEFLLTVPNSYSAYQWSRNGQPIPGATTNTLSATAAGEYTVTSTGQGGCPSGSCCPFIVVSDPVPSLTAVAVSAQCVGVTPQNNAAITLAGANSLAVSYNITKGSSFTTASPLFGSPQALSAVVNGVLLGGQPNPATAQDYTIRVYGANGCFADTVVTIQPTVCNCPPAVCAPVVIKKTKTQGKSI